MDKEFIYILSSGNEVKVNESSVDSFLKRFPNAKLKSEEEKEEPIMIDFISPKTGNKVKVNANDLDNFRSRFSNYELVNASDKDFVDVLTTDKKSREDLRRELKFYIKNKDLRLSEADFEKELSSKLSYYGFDVEQTGIGESIIISTKKRSQTGGFGFSGPVPQRLSTPSKSITFDVNSNKDFNDTELSRINNFIFENADIDYVLKAKKEMPEFADNFANTISEIRLTPDKAKDMMDKDLENKFEDQKFYENYSPVTFGYGAPGRKPEDPMLTDKEKNKYKLWLKGEHFEDDYTEEEVNKYIQDNYNANKDRVASGIFRNLNDKQRGYAEAIEYSLFNQEPDRLIDADANIKKYKLKIENKYNSFNKTINEFAEKYPENYKFNNQQELDQRNAQAKDILSTFNDIMRDQEKIKFLDKKFIEDVDDFNKKIKYADLALEHAGKNYERLEQFSSIIKSGASNILYEAANVGRVIFDSVGTIIPSLKTTITGARTSAEPTTGFDVDEAGNVITVERQPSISQQRNSIEAAALLNKDINDELSLFQYSPKWSEAKTSDDQLAWLATASLNGAFSIGLAAGGGYYSLPLFGLLEAGDQGVQAHLGEISAKKRISANIDLLNNTNNNLQREAIQKQIDEDFKKLSLSEAQLLSQETNAFTQAIFWEAAIGGVSILKSFKHAAKSQNIQDINKAFKAAGAALTRGAVGDPTSEVFTEFFVKLGEKYLLEKDVNIFEDLDEVAMQALIPGIGLGSYGGLSIVNRAIVLENRSSALAKRSQEIQKEISELIPLGSKLEDLPPRVQELVNELVMENKQLEQRLLKDIREGRITKEDLIEIGNQNKIIRKNLLYAQQVNRDVSLGTLTPSEGKKLIEKAKLKVNQAVAVKDELATPDVKRGKKTKSIDEKEFIKQNTIARRAVSSTFVKVIANEWNNLSSKEKRKRNKEAKKDPKNKTKDQIELAARNNYFIERLKGQYDTEIKSAKNYINFLNEKNPGLDMQLIELEQTDNKDEFAVKVFKKDSYEKLNKNQKNVVDDFIKSKSSGEALSDNTLVIDKNRSIQTASIGVGHHEILHGLIKRITNGDNSLANRFGESLLQFLRKSNPDLAATIEQRLENDYVDENGVKAPAYFEEAMNVLSDVFTNKDMSTDIALVDNLVNIVNKVLPSSFAIEKSEGAKVYDFVKRFNKASRGADENVILPQKPRAAVITDKEEPRKSRIVQTLNELVPENSTKESWKAGDIADAFTAISVDGILDGSIKNELNRRGVTPTPDLIEKVNDKVVENLLTAYDPTNPAGLGGYLIGGSKQDQTAFRGKLSLIIGDIIGAEMRQVKTVSRDKEIDAKEGQTITAQVPDTSIQETVEETKQREKTEQEKIISRRGELGKTRKPLKDAIKFEDKTTISGLKNILLNIVKNNKALFEFDKDSFLAYLKEQATGRWFEIVRDEKGNVVKSKAGKTKVKSKVKVTDSWVLIKNAMNWPKKDNKKSYEKFLLDNKKAIIEGLTTTYLAKAFPFAIEKFVITGVDSQGNPTGNFTTDWKPNQVVGTKPGNIDFIRSDKDVAELQGNTTGRQRLRRKIDISDEQWINHFKSGPKAWPQMKNEPLWREISGEINYELFQEEVNKFDEYSAKLNKISNDDITPDKKKQQIKELNESDEFSIISAFANNQNLLTDAKVDQTIGDLNKQLQRDIRKYNINNEDAIAILNELEQFRQLDEESKLIYVNNESWEDIDKENILKNIFTEDENYHRINLSQLTDDKIIEGISKTSLAQLKKQAKGFTEATDKLKYLNNLSDFNKAFILDLAYNNKLLDNAGQRNGNVTEKYVHEQFMSSANIFNRDSPDIKINVLNNPTASNSPIKGDIEYEVVKEGKQLYSDRIEIKASMGGIFSGFVIPIDKIKFKKQGNKFVLDDTPLKGVKGEKIQIEDKNGDVISEEIINEFIENKEYWENIFNQYHNNLPQEYKNTKLDKTGKVLNKKKDFYGTFRGDFHTEALQKALENAGKTLIIKDTPNQNETDVLIRRVYKGVKLIVPNGKDLYAFDANFFNRLIPRFAAKDNKPFKGTRNLSIKRSGSRDVKVPFKKGNKFVLPTPTVKTSRVYVKIDLRISNGKDLQQSQESLSKKETQEKIRRNGNNRHYAKRSKQAEDASAVFNKIIEQNKGIAADDNLSQTLARQKGRDIGKYDFFLPASADDFMGLMYSFLGEGKLGDQQKEFFEEMLNRPYKRGIASIDSAKQKIEDDYKILKRKFPEVSKKLGKKIPGSEFTYDQAIRVYLWKYNAKANETNLDILGLSNSEINSLFFTVANDQKLQRFARGLGVITGLPEGYLKPTPDWSFETIASDINNVIEKVGRKKFLSEFIENRKIIFSKENLNKIEAIYGTRFREALEDSLYAMENGTSRNFGNNRVANEFANWLNSSTGVTMFINMRSASLQLISSINYLNWSDNNFLQAAKAFANQKQFWADFEMIVMSDKLKQRRKGLNIDVQAAELASSVATSKSKYKSALRYLLRIGFTPTQAADAIAISFGGASFYRNRVNTYLSKGFNKKEAETKAFEDFSEETDAAQQSADPSRLSQEQRNPVARFFLTFQNVALQYNRRIKKSILDLINKRGDGVRSFEEGAWKTHISKIIYYGIVQNLIFNAAQSALFTLLYDDDDETSEEEKRKIVRVANGMSDTILRGLGYKGAIAATLKNVILKYYEQEKKGPFKADHFYTAIEIANVAPTIGSKFRKIYKAHNINYYDRDVIAVKGYEFDSPRYEVYGNLISAFFNIPVDRAITKIKNLRLANESYVKSWQKIALIAGWPGWSLNLENEEHEKIKAEGAKTRKRLGVEKAKETRARNIAKKKAEEKAYIEKMTEGMNYMERGNWVREYLKQKKLEKNKNK